MARPVLEKVQGNSASTTLSSAVTNSDTAFPITNTTGFAGEGMVIIDEGTANEEYAYATELVGSTLTIPLANRGLEGSSAVAHLASATIKGVLTAGTINNINTALENAFVEGTGAVDTTKIVGIGMTGAALTSPKITTGINDANNNEVIKTPATTSAVNEVTITNAATGNAPEISATGGDSNINLKLSAKGTGKVLLDGYYTTPLAYSPAGAATQDLDLSLGNTFDITMPAGNITLTVSNEVNGQYFVVTILQDSGGSRTVTWFSTIRWAGGTAPTLTTTASKRDTFGFRVTGTDTYDGFVIGRNA